MKPEAIVGRPIDEYQKEVLDAALDWAMPDVYIHPAEAVKADHARLERLRAAVSTWQVLDEEAFYGDDA